MTQPTPQLPPTKSNSALSCPANPFAACHFRRQFPHRLLAKLLIAMTGVFSFGNGGYRVGAQPPVDFAHEVVPLLQAHCVSCHGGREAKGSFSLNTRELVVNSGHVEVGKPDESYLIELIGSTDADMQMPPSDKPRMPLADQQLLARWIAEGALWDAGFSFAPQSYEPPLKPRRPELPAAINGREHPLDRILDAYRQAYGQALPQPIDDAAFLRRVSLDLIGLLPDPEQLSAFVADTAPDKRARWVDQLLQDDIAYADHWLTFFNDLLRNDYSGTGFITGGRAQISGWLYDSLLQNKPFDLMARELIAPPNDTSRGYIDGIKWRGEVSAGQTVEIQFAQSVSQSFLGINMKCASCHDSFIDRWKLDEAFGLAAIYSERPLEINRCDKPIGQQAQAKWLFPELGEIDANQPRDARLKQLAKLMTHPENGRFTRTIANRLWYKLMGRGIVHPLDAMQSEPWNADLLDYLAVSLADNNYDLKSTLRLIATSQSYQAPAVAQALDTAGKFTFSGPIARRMTAEQFLDNVWKLTQSAPLAIDAPIVRAPVPGTPLPELAGQWIWGDSAADGKTPAAGETIAIRKRFVLPAAVERGGAMITCDNSFVLRINGHEAMRGDNWMQLQSLPLHTLLREGENEFYVLATNAGTDPNPAGLYVVMHLMLADGTALTLASDATWEFTADPPQVVERRVGVADWSPATVVPSVAPWTQVIRASGPNALRLALTGPGPMVRASLVKNDFLMKSLGRPLREQIVSMRPNDLTTLEAIDLSNGPTFAKSLENGGKILAEREWKDRSELVKHVFQSALCRDPQPAELKSVLAYMSQRPTPPEIEDLLWSVLMMPEFMLIH